MHHLKPGLRDAAFCRHKMDKKKSSKSVKGDSEVYRKNGAKDAQRSKTSKKDAKGKAQEHPKYRKSAYEEYQSRYAAKPETDVRIFQNPPCVVHSP